MTDRTTPLSFRVTPDLKAALEQAAAQDSRSVSSLIIKVLTEWSVANKYLPEKAVSARSRIVWRPGQKKPYS